MKLQLTRDYNDYRTKTQVKIEQVNMSKIKQLFILSVGKAFIGCDK